MKIDFLNSTSIGVIGGADGPTKIVVTSSPIMPYIIAGITGLVAIGVVLLIVGLIRKTKE